MFNWGKKKTKSSSNKRVAPQAHKHPQYNSNPPRVPKSPIPNSSNANRQQQNRSNHISPIKAKSSLRANGHQQHNIDNDNNDDESEEDDDMFGGMMVNDDDSDEEEEPPKSKQSESKQRTLSVEDLNKLSEEDQLTMALQLSMGNTSQKSNKSNPTKINQPIASTSSNISMPIIDKAKIEWPTVPTSPTNEEKTNDANANIENAEASAFGFDLGTNDNDNNDDINNEEAVTQSAFGFDLGATDKKKEEKEELNESVNEEENVSMFGGMDIAKEENSPSPSPSPSIPAVDESVLSQLKRAEMQHQKSRKRIWSKIKQCIERAQDIKDKESELNRKLIVENDKKLNAESMKKTALQNANFEEAEKAKNLIRRAMKRMSDINHEITKCGVDLKAMNLSKTEQESIYIEESGDYKERLNVLYNEHKEAMSVSINNEYQRIEKEEKKFKEKLDRTEREIQLDDENIEKCKDKLDKIEDLIKNDVEPFQENLDKQNSEKQILELEIDELNKQLLAKQEELSNVERSIGGLNDEIMKVRKEYKDQTDEILDEQSRFEGSKHKFNLKKNEFVLTLERLDADNIKNKESEQEFEKELQRLQAKIAKINKSFERFEEKKERQMEWNKEEQRLLDCKSQIDKKVESKKYEIERFEKELKQIDSKCIHHRQTVANIDSALPILHSDKTTAVNNENYLEAGKLHKQIQTKTAQKDKSLEQLKSLNDKREEIKQKLKEEQCQYVELKKKMENIGIEIHEQRFKLVMEHRIAIKASLDALSNDENIDDADDDDVERIVLSKELDQIQSELEFFHSKYGWNIDWIENENDVLSANNAEEHEEDTAKESVVEKKTKKEIVEEMESVQQEIATKNAEKEQLQSDINKAVAMEQYEEAGKLAPKKKKLILQTQELQQRLKDLEQMIEECEDDKEENAENEDPNDNEINTDEPGHNGIIQNGQENEPVDVVEDQNENKIKDEIEPNGQIEDSDQDKDENNMFGDMTVKDNDEEQDTVNID